MKNYNNLMQLNKIYNLNKKKNPEFLSTKREQLQINIKNMYKLLSKLERFNFNLFKKQGKMKIQEEILRSKFTKILELNSLITPIRVNLNANILEMKNKISLLMNNYSQDKNDKDLLQNITALKDQLDILLCEAIKNKALLANNVKKITHNEEL
jgi:hypothetical protein